MPINWHFDSDIVIHPISDLHIGSKECDQAAWDKFTKKILAEKNSYIAIAGDMMNNALKTSVSNVYEETMRPREQKAWLVERLTPLKDRILCGTGGNHEYRSAKDADDDPLYDVFCKIGIEDLYRENIAFPILRFGDMKGNGLTNPTYTMAVTHGAGGGMYIGSGANRVERFGGNIDGLDCLVTGHTHKPITFPAAKLFIDPQNNKVSQKQFVVVVASSWLEYGGYPVRKLLTPTARVLQEIRFSRSRKEIRVLQ